MLGIDRLKREITALLNLTRQELHAGLGRLERKVDKLPTREELDALKAQLKQAIQDATNRVATDIQALRNQLAAGQPITDQDLADIQEDITGVGQIDPANPTPPASRRKP